LLYHFGTKRALVAALVADLVARFEAVRARRAAPGGPGANTKAYLLATFDAESREIDRASAGVLAALAEDPTLLGPLRVATRRWQAQLGKDGIDPVDATLVRLAVDGLWFSRLLGNDPLPGPLRTKVLRRLSTLARGERTR
jgi:AcrR family transcriptional regulator